jgi:hypothetical protein
MHSRYSGGRLCAKTSVFVAYLPKAAIPLPAHSRRLGAVVEGPTWGRKRPSRRYRASDFDYWRDVTSTCSTAPSRQYSKVHKLTMPSGRSISVLRSAVPLQFFIGIILTSHFHSRARQKWPDENQHTTTEWEEEFTVSQKLIDIASRPTQSPHGRL